MIYKKDSFQCVALMFYVIAIGMASWGGIKVSIKLIIYKKDFSQNTGLIYVIAIEMASGGGIKVVIKLIIYKKDFSQYALFVGGDIKVNMSGITFLFLMNLTNIFIFLCFRHVRLRPSEI